jgi:hypothetical protein
MFAAADTVAVLQPATLQTLQERNSSRSATAPEVQFTSNTAAVTKICTAVK